ncbi:hypothetical protein [Nocardia asteroides]|uniref:hypothetical protein n=1 Tax=Nocardia asteroides TaxID=1824 RepID=UPI001E5E7D04|nr:hypothetical protein [Nocardia asteroides]UGT63663.1 hypothetical protein LTT61_10265 [Nocardia asteroides]
MLWRDVRGVFEARVGERVVRGWAPTVEDMATLLRRYGATATTGPVVSLAPAPADLDHVRAGHLDQDPGWPRLLRAAADRPQRDTLRAGLGQLRDRIPAGEPELRDWLYASIAEVDAAAPLVERLAVFDGTPPVPYVPADGPRAGAQSLDWVDPRTVLAVPGRARALTDDDRWSLAGFCRTLRVAETEPELRSWMDDFLLGGGARPIRLVRVEGPAGPVYELRGDGARRLQFARAFGLPVLALVRAAQLPRPLIPESTSATTGFDRWGELWRGLRRHRMLDVTEDAGHATPRWNPTRLAADWLLLPPAAATAAGRAYDRLHPGALAAATGLPAAVLLDADRWAGVLLAD